MPDFAFPRTVDKNASAKLEEAMSRKDGLTALQAAIQIDVARSLVSASSFKESAERFDSIAGELGSPWSNLALILEAKMYSQLYLSQPWTFNNRTIPASPVPDNVMEWNSRMLSDKVMSLTSRAFENSSSLAGMPMSEISALLTDSDDAVKAGFSVLDFMTLQSVSSLSAFDRINSKEVIPFGSANDNARTATVSGAVSSLLTEAIARHSADDEKFAEAYFCNARLDRMRGDERHAYAEKCYDAFRETPYGAAFLAAYCEGLDLKNANVSAVNELRRLKYDLLTSYKDRFPGGYGISSVESMINMLTDKKVSVEFPDRLLAGRTDSVTVSARNLYDIYVLVYSLPGKSVDGSCKYSRVKQAGKLVTAVPVRFDGTVPDMFEGKFRIPPLNPGRYAFVPSTSPDASGIINKNDNASVSTTLVGNISVIKSELNVKGERMLYVVSSVDNRPVPGAKVLLYKITNGKRGAQQVLITDRAGAVVIPDGTYDYEAQSGRDYVSGHLYRNYYNERKSEKRLDGSVLTDLGIYRPGDSVGYAGIVYTSEDNVLSAAGSRKVNVFLKDANWQTVDSLTVESDRYGRFDGSFRLPESGLLGNWQIVLMDGERWVANNSFEVAEYKSPTFYVNLDSADGSYKAGETLRFKGKAFTYSGMPVGEGKVAFTVEFVPLWWRSEGAGAAYGGETVTAADGSFEIVLPTDGLVGTTFSRGGFVLKVSVTNPAGETRESQPVRFALGNSLRINTALPDKLEITDKSREFNVSVIDAIGHPVVKTVYYDISADGRTVDSGKFEAPVFNPALKDLKSGKYAFRFSLTPDFVSTDDCEAVTDSVVLWRTSDSRPADTTVLWIDNSSVVAAAGEKSVRIRVGSSFPDSYVLAQISDSHKLIGNEWIHVKNGFASIEVKAPSDNEQVFVNLIGAHDLSMRSATVRVIPFAQTIKLESTVETFRDRITPGARETWKFRYDLNGKKQADIPVMAVMTNKALNALAPFRWAFDPSSSLYWNPVASLGFKSPFNLTNTASVYRKTSVTDTKPFAVPQWQTYGYLLANGGNMLDQVVVTNLSYKSTALSAGVRVRGTMALDEAKVESVEEEAPADSAADAGNAGEAAVTDEIPLRQTEFPLAFFMPKFSTDGDGVATVEFTAPEFVGTWQFQILGYTPDMKGSVLTLDALSSKKVMAQMNAPRFVRTGDTVSVSATIYNNSESEQAVTGRIEFVNPLTGEVISSALPNTRNVKASESCVVEATMVVPDDIEAITVRAYGEIPGYSDGEQTVIPVLPSSTPVVESTPFYIAPESGEFTMKLPVLDKDANVTLTYCDNPVWECVTALPSIVKPKSVNILSQVHALFGTGVASGLFNRYPELVKGVLEMADPVNAGDSSLYSPLQKNPELKTVLLNNTPWVNDASSETIRMQGLVKYSDPAEASAMIADIMKTLRDRQNSDGGWSWCPDMKSSTFITGEVIRVMGLLQNMGYLPAGGEALVKRACGYMDKELADAWNRSERKSYSLSGLLDYLYSKSAFKGIGASSAFAPLDRLAMKDIESGWRDLSIGQKATAAILLERRGSAKTARVILESLRQFASESKEKGMWYDNLNSGWNGMGTLLTTARVLEAYAAIEPANPAIDKLRQWLVVSKQTRNWGDDSRSAEAINALLTSGSEWTAASSVPVVSLGGNPIQVENVSAVTGSFKVTLDASTASGAELSVRRSGSGPAWGGVVAQYVAPVADVKAASVPQLSVSKSVYKVTPGPDGLSASNDALEVGDLVKVTITIVCDRDIEYVAVTDPRAACLEPADQISCYTQSDGVWFYREVRDSSTNLFIPFLSKGSHVISYNCYVDRTGDYSLGVANAQSQYAPVITAHSSGAMLPVK